MKIDAALSQKITIVSLACSIAVCLNHAVTLTVSYPQQAGVPGALAAHAIEGFARYGTGRLTTPFFFALSAYLLFAGCPAFRSDYPSALSKRLRTVLVPFLIWSSTSFALMYALQSLPLTAGHFERGLASLSMSELAAKLFWDPVAYPLWFLRELMLLVLLAPVFRVVFHRREIAIVALLGLLAVWFMAHTDRHTRSLFFFGIGTALALHRPSLAPVRPWELRTLVLTWLAFAFAHVAYVMAFSTEQPVLNNVTILYGLLSLWIGYERLAERLRHPWLSYVGGYTFLVYATHEPLATILRKGLTSAFGSSPWMSLVSWGATAVTLLVVCNGFAMLLARYAPAACSLVGGGRAARPQRSAQLQKAANSEAA